VHVQRAGYIEHVRHTGRRTGTPYVYHNVNTVLVDSYSDLVVSLSPNLMQVYGMVIARCRQVELIEHVYVKTKIGDVIENGVRIP